MKQYDKLAVRTITYLVRHGKKDSRLAKNDRTVTKRMSNRNT